MFKNSIICIICGRSIAKLGMRSHIAGHGLDYTDYRNKFLLSYGKCKNCGKDVIEPRQFCNKECSIAFSKGKSHAVHRDTIKIKDLSEKQIKDILLFYAECPRSPQEMYDQFHISEDTLERILKENSVPSYKCWHFVKKNYEEKIDNFLRSDEGMGLIQEYQFSDGSLRSLSKKYGLGRKFIKKILEKAGVEIKSCKQVRRELEKIKRIKGIHGHRYGKPSPVGSGKSRWFLYKDVKYQGSWEFKLGLWFQYRNISFLCHTGVKRFEYSSEDGLTKTYCPDFYVLDENYYIDVKGYFSESDKKKMAEVRKLYPDVRFEIFDKEKLTEMEVLGIDKTLGIRIEDYVLDYKKGDIIIDRFLSSVDPLELARKKLIDHKNLSILSREYNIPYSLMCRAYYRVVPKEASNEFYQFMADHFLNSDLIRKQCLKSPIYTITRNIDNGLDKKRNLEIVKRIKDGRISCL